ncbi:hypothetical protein LRP30_21305 [Bradyrhizobium sp. C-145]|nr:MULTISPECIES: hypothetical protein [Bradyrhizobium]UQR67628.1 hypothetical protein LRP30_21305 [Bradyrhizobium sp. C-145]
MNIHELKGPAVIHEQLIKARAELEAKLRSASGSSERKFLADQIATVELVLQEVSKERNRPAMYRELDELTDRERVMARIAKSIGRGRDVVYHGTRALPEVMRAGKLVPPNLAEFAVFFTRSAELAAYFACLRGEKKERRSAGVLILDKSSLRQSYRLEPNRYDPLDGRNEREEAVWGRTISFRRHLLGVVSEANVSEVLGPPEWPYLPPGFVRWPEAKRRKFNERQLASGREFVAKGRAAVRDLIVSERFLKSKMK